ncbi:MAG: peptidylprolyl isomerase [candidate division Zixibacteria bacterium]|nr:peptidylprolyl isomerase [candidate division Zixibacteria bacterium]
MRRSGFIFLIGLLGLLAGQTARSERDVVDKIIVVVGDRVILASELASQIQLYAFQTGIQPKTEAEIQQLQADILEQMINDQLFLLEAKQDTSVSVRPEEIEQALDEHVTRVAGNFESQEAFIEALTAEGLTVRELKKKYRGDIENQLLRQRYIQRKLYSVSVSRHEVEEFYSQFRDSIPSQPEAAKLAHILLAYKPSQVVEDSIQALASRLRQKILDGADFAAIAAQYSSMGAGANGGDLGFVGRDDVVPEFSRAAFNLSVGDISGVIRTQFGYHVIKCEDKKGERLHLRHLLLAVGPSAADSLAVRQRADSLLQAARSGSDFAEMAKTFSDDNDTRAKGGELGWFAVSQLPAEFAAEVLGWKNPGEYRGPVASRYGVHVLRLMDYQEEKKFDLENDFDKIKELARQDKTGKMVDRWIEEIKAKTYIDYRL